MLWKFLLGLLLAYFGFLIFKDKKALLKKEVDTVSSYGKSLIPPNVEVPQPPSRSTLHVFQQAAVCSDKSSCSNIGTDIMHNGGNAMDSAIATLLCNGLVTMQSMSLGGGVLMTYYSKEEQKAYNIMGRERAPLQLKLEALQTLKTSENLAQSSLAIAVPGEVAAYYEAHKRFGSLPWQAIVQPTVDLCSQGYRLTRHQRDALLLNEKNIKNNVMLRQMFVITATKQFLREGSHITIPHELCLTYKRLMHEGAASFYNGTVGALMVKDLQDIGSSITQQDLSEYRADIVDALKVDLDSFNLYVPQPPGSGHVLAFVMQILKNFKTSFSKLKDLHSKDVHRIVEALKFGFVKRWEYDMQMDKGILENLTSANYGYVISQLIDELKTYENPARYGANVALFSRPDYGTAQISILAPNGDAVSATSSINYYFGSGHMGTRTGILFNNAISDFTIDGLQNYFNLPNIQKRNQLKPQMQPMSSMVPLIVTHKNTGEVRLVTGAAGGTRIISTLIQILIRILWMDNNIKEAIDAERFHHQLMPNILEYEFGVLQEVIEDLEFKGHVTERVRQKNTAVCGVESLKGVVFANADYRKEGAVEGF